MQQPLLQMLAEFEEDGFTILRSIVSDEQIKHLTDAVEVIRKDQFSPGLRNLLSRSIVIKTFALSGMVYRIAEEVLGVKPTPVRAILFDKTPEANWYVTWHQDLSVPIKSRIDVDGYGPWSVKDGILHAQPPASILEKMVSLRIHLDSCMENNGAIKFIAGSHLSGILRSEELVYWRDNYSPIVCSAERGDVIVMRPLILHSSSGAEEPQHRRVLHLEYAGIELPSGLEWAEA